MKKIQAVRETTSEFMHRFERIKFLLGLAAGPAILSGYIVLMTWIVQPEKTIMTAITLGVCMAVCAGIVLIVDWRIRKDSGI